MSLNAPILFVEISNENYEFIAGQFDENNKFVIHAKVTTSNDGIDKKKFINLEDAYKTIKTSIENIESKLGLVFKEVIIILDTLNYTCSNVTGYKKLNGSQIYKENISYILNYLKSSITENESKNSIVHIFNSKSVLDGTEVENLPIGLFGDFYVHDLTFFLISKNDLKNIKLLFNKHNIEVKKFFLKNFVEGTQLIKLKDYDTFIKIKINKNFSNISLFYKSAFIYSEDFDYGSNIIYKDIEKICSINKEIIKNFLSDNVSSNGVFEESELIEERYFIKDNYRKIRKKLIFDIADARIEEIMNFILNKNSNIKTFHVKNFKVFVLFQDKSIEKTFKNLFQSQLSKKNYIETDFVDNFSIETTIEKALQLNNYGWKNEAIPITHQKKSLITKLFKLLFG